MSGIQGTDIEGQGVVDLTVSPKPPQGPGVVGGGSGPPPPVGNFLVTGTGDNIVTGTGDPILVYNPI